MHPWCCISRSLKEGVLNFPVSSGSLVILYLPSPHTLVYNMLIRYYERIHQSYIFHNDNSYIRLWSGTHAFRKSLYPTMLYNLLHKLIQFTGLASYSTLKSSQCFSYFIKCNRIALIHFSEKFSVFSILSQFSCQLFRFHIHFIMC